MSLKDIKKVKVIFTADQESLSSAFVLNCKALKKFTEVEREFQSAIFLRKSIERMYESKNTVAVIVKNLPPELAVYAVEDYKNEMFEMFSRLDDSFKSRNNYLIFWLKREIVGLDFLKGKFERIKFLRDSGFEKFWRSSFSREIKKVNEDLFFQKYYKNVKKYYLLIRDERIFYDFFPDSKAECRKRYVRVKENLRKAKFKGISMEEEFCVIQAKSTPVIKEMKEKLEKIAENNESVFIYGESGTGKECIASAIYTLRKFLTRASGPFIARNCAVIPENLLESELFGYVKGAFTGADSDKKGIVEMAENGILFLDEIDKMPMTLQSKLLRFIQFGTFYKVGSPEERKVKNVKVVAASNILPEKAIKDNKLLRDLYYRLSTFVVKLPPLREWDRDDRLRLINTFVYEFTRSNSGFAEKYIADHVGSSLKFKLNGKGLYYTILPPEVIKYLLQMDFSEGNARELRRVLIRYLSYGKVETDDEIFAGRGYLVGGEGRLAERKTFAVELNLSNLPSIDDIRRLYARYVYENLAGGVKKKAAEILGVTSPTLNSLLEE